MNKLLAWTLAVCSIPLCWQAQACTDFRITAQDGSITVARSMEFASDMQSNLRTSPRGRSFQSIAPNQKPGLSWKAEYGYVFLDAYQQDVALDGMNEKGLSLEALYLPGETEYQSVPAGKEKKSIAYLSFGDWVLGRFQTVEEVKKALADIYVTTEMVPGMGDMVFPLHFAIHDASGKGIVVEFTKGAMQVYDNEVGILTNSPTYDWQVTNLRNYVNLSPLNPNPVMFGKMAFVSTGQGSGMKGLPGDVSPPSRFAKIAAMKASIVPAVDANDALNLAQHIINNVDIPAGFVRANVNGKEEMETTQWTVFKDLTHKIFYYHTYGDTTLHSIDFTKLNLAENAPRLKMPVADNQYIIAATDTFKQHLAQ